MKLIWAFLAVTALVFASPIVEQMLDTIVIEAAIGQTCFQRHGYNFVSRWSCRSTLHSFGYPALAASCNLGSLGLQKKNDFCLNFERIVRENDEHKEARVTKVEIDDQSGNEDRRIPQGNAVSSTEDKRNPPRNPVTPTQPRNPVTDIQEKRNPQRASVIPPRLSQSEVDALRARLMALWSPPVGVQDPNELIVNVTIRLRPDGRLAAPPFARVNGRSVAAMASRDSALRAVTTGQPFDMLKPEHYESWKELEVTFDPKDMFRSN